MVCFRFSKAQVLAALISCCGLGWRTVVVHGVLQASTWQEAKGQEGDRLAKELMVDLRQNQVFGLCEIGAMGWWPGCRDRQASLALPKLPREQRTLEEQRT